MDLTPGRALLLSRTAQLGGRRDGLTLADTVAREGHGVGVWWSLDLGED